MSVDDCRQCHFLAGPYRKPLSQSDAALLLSMLPRTVEYHPLISDTYVLRPILMVKPDAAGEHGRAAAHAAFLAFPWLRDRAMTDRFQSAAALLGAKGGAAGKGAAKRRNVDYAALGRKGGLAGKGKRHK